MQKFLFANSAFDTHKLAPKGGNSLGSADVMHSLGCVVSYASNAQTWAIRTLRSCDLT